MGRKRTNWKIKFINKKIKNNGKCRKTHKRNGN